MIARSISVIFLILSTVSTLADAFLDAALLLDRLKIHYQRSSSWMATSYATALYRQPPMAYIKQLHKRKDRRKSYLLAGKRTTDGSTSEPKTKRSDLLFQQRLSELKDFIDQNGHGSIPTPYDDNPPLGVWAANLRRQFVIREHAEQESAPYKGFLTEERMEILKESGFDFTSLTERQFNMRLLELKEFKERYGHTLVPEKYEENMALGAWVSNMRTLYKKKRLESDAAPAIEEKVNGDNGIIKVRYSKNMLQQEIQPTKQRRRRQRSKRNSQLDDEKERLLNELQFVWNAKDRKWFEMLEWAKVYAVVNYELASSRDENSTVSIDTDDGSFNRSQLDEQDALLLDNYYTFVKNIQDPSLLPYFHPQDEILDLLRDENYVESVLKQTQHLQHTFPVTDRKVSNRTDACPTLDYRVPVTDTLHYSLRIWMVNQRSNYHRRLQNTTDAGAIPSTMTDQRQHALDEINFPWSGRFANRCEEIQYEIEQMEKNRIEMEKARKREQKLKEEQEKIAQLKIRQDATPLYAPVTPDVAENDIMSLWGAGDDEDEEDIW
jgi:hypothetical protein